MSHLGNTELFGEPSKQEWLAIVAWMSLCNAFGQVSEEVLYYGEPGLTKQQMKMVIKLAQAAKIRTHKFNPHRQTILPNRKRKVTVS